MRNFCVGLLIIGVLLGCERAEPVYAPRFSETPLESQEELIFGVHPLHNPHRLFEVYDPLITHLNQQLRKNPHFAHVKFRLEASINYNAYEKKLYTQEFAFALPNPYQTLFALERGYRLFGKMGDDNKFRGLILVRKDQDIHDVMQLKGKSVSYPACTALAGTLMPQYFLQQHGLNVHKDLNNLYVGSQESSIMNVLLKKTTAGATWIVPWERFQEKNPELAQQLTIQWQTESLPNNSLMARNDMPDELVSFVSQFFLNLHTYPEGQALLKRIPLAYFESADSTTYQAVADFMQRFNQVVGTDPNCPPN